MKYAELNILLVEDNPGDSRLISEMLKESLHITDTLAVAENMSAAISKLSGHIYDLIILDFNLPDSSGLVTLDTVIKITAGLIPVIVLTGTDDEEIGVISIEHGAKDYLVKGSVNLSIIKRSIRYTIERMKAELAQRDSDERYRMIFENSMDAFLLTEPNGSILSVNPAGCSMFSLSEKDIMEKGRADILDLSDPSLKKAIEIRNRTGHFHGELTGLKSDGTKFPIEVSTMIFADRKGISQTSMIIRDITERKRAEDSLKESNRFLNILLDAIPVPVFYKDTDGRYIGVNRSFEKFHGQLLIDIVGKNVFDIIPNEAAKFNHSFDKELFQNPGLQVYETHVMDAAGVYHDLICHKATFMNSNGCVGGLIGVLLDITEQKRMVEELAKINRELEQRVSERTADLEKSNRELDSFSYSVSHDLRAPLRHITGFLDIFRREAGDLINGKTGQYLDVIDESVKRMERLINDLLAFSRMGRTELSSNSVSMETLTDEVLNEYSDDIKNGKISIIRRPLPEVKGDRNMLRVVLVNLISNAIKFTSKTEKPEIEIGCSVIENENTFYVRDNGAGFDMRYADKLFGIFKRLHSDQDFKGTGIGLAIVKNIIERHKGRVRAEAEPGKGACFYFTISMENK